MSGIRIYLEGGGQENASKRLIRNGFDAFLGPLRDLARAKQMQWAIIPCGPRNVAFENFEHALRDHPDAFNVLLIDSEEQVSSSGWEHLRQRDRWQTAHLPEENCHLMVQTIEAWLIADPDALADYYGQRFRRNALPKRDDVEAIPKDQLYKSLERATSDTQKGPYHKIRHCADLLSLLSRERVRQRARHCDLLFRTLEARIASS
jgi:hypothetical protein